MPSRKSTEEKEKSRRKGTDEEDVEVVAPEPEVEEAEPVLAEAPGAEPATIRKAVVKEIPQFRWKVVATSTRGETVTLYKAVEREDVEAQAERMKGDSYYYDIRVVGIELAPPKPAVATEAPPPAPAVEAPEPPAPKRPPTPKPVKPKAAAAKQKTVAAAKPPRPSAKKKPKATAKKAK